MTTNHPRCECYDPGCPHVDKGGCSNNADYLLYRVDMNDESGTAMCDICADDASDSGLFRMVEL